MHDTGLGTEGCSAGSRREAQGEVGAARGEWSSPKLDYVHMDAAFDQVRGPGGAAAD